MQEQEFEHILEGCRRQHRASQQRLYALFYNYAMTIARRYVGNLETAEEVLNDAFFKVFTKINLYNGSQPFRPWLRRVVINTALDRLRMEVNIPNTEELSVKADQDIDTGIIENLTYQQILLLLGYLPPAYRMVFNLFVADGFSHEEIAEMLNISVGTSKSNLSRARQHLKNLLSNEFSFERSL